MDEESPWGAPVHPAPPASSSAPVSDLPAFSSAPATGSAALDDGFYKPPAWDDDDDAKADAPASPQLRRRESKRNDEEDGWGPPTDLSYQPPTWGASEPGPSSPRDEVDTGFSSAALERRDSRDNTAAGELPSATRDNDWGSPELPPLGSMRLDGGSPGASMDVTRDPAAAERDWAPPEDDLEDLPPPLPSFGDSFAPRRPGRRDSRGSAGAGSDERTRGWGDEAAGADDDWTAANEHAHAHVDDETVEDLDRDGGEGYGRWHQEQEATAVREEEQEDDQQRAEQTDDDKSKQQPGQGRRWFFSRSREATATDTKQDASTQEDAAPEPRPEEQKPAPKRGWFGSTKSTASEPERQPSPAPVVAPPPPPAPVPQPSTSIQTQASQSGEPGRLGRMFRFGKRGDERPATGATSIQGVPDSKSGEDDAFSHIFGNNGSKPPVAPAAAANASSSSDDPFAAFSSAPAAASSSTAGASSSTDPLDPFAVFNSTAAPRPHIGPLAGSIVIPRKQSPANAISPVSGGGPRSGSSSRATSGGHGGGAALPAPQARKAVNASFMPPPDRPGSSSSMGPLAGDDDSPWAAVPSKSTSPGLRTHSPAFGGGLRSTSAGSGHAGAFGIGSAPLLPPPPAAPSPVNASLFAPPPPPAPTSSAPKATSPTAISVPRPPPGISSTPLTATLMAPARPIQRPLSATSGNSGASSNGASSPTTQQQINSSRPSGLSRADLSFFENL